MLKRQFKNPWYYMVRLANGEWSPAVKHNNLNKAMNEAVRLSKKFNQSATVLATLGQVEIVEGEPRWIDITPK